jgi:YD repeat-containing protein
LKLCAKKDAENQNTSYTYDAASQLIATAKPNGWDESYIYDAAGQMLSQLAKDPSDKINKQILHTYQYDPVGNQSTMTYPDNTVVTNTYDLLGRLTNVKDAENQNTVYAYDAASQLLAQNYPNGRKHEHEYDDAGRLTSTFEHDPTNTPVKTLRFEFTYDAQGNLLTNFRRGVGEGRVNENFTYEYDALNRLTMSTGHPSSKVHEYTYDSLGNLTFEQSGNNKTVDYKHNSLNQMVSKTVDNHPNQYYTYTYDNRGNLVTGTFHKNTNQTETAEQYVYDATNRMTIGTNDIGETSEYVFNGLGYLVKNVWTVKQNAYGYTNITVRVKIRTFVFHALPELE